MLHVIKTQWLPPLLPNSSKKMESTPQARGKFVQLAEEDARNQAKESVGGLVSITQILSMGTRLSTPINKLKKKRDHVEKPKRKLSFALLGHIHWGRQLLGAALTVNESIDALLKKEG